MTNKWEILPFSNCLVENNVGRANQINASEIKKEGRYPVIDQGQDFIAGYSDEEEKLVKDGLPFIIFGDHTRCFKFIDFPFIIGADGTKVLSPNHELFNPKFFYFQLLNLNIPSRGYNRHFKLLKEKYILRPELQEQTNIAYILSKVQQIIEKYEKLIVITNELKKALIQKLLSEGVKNEKQKSTELGMMPESWSVICIGDYSNIVTSFPTFVKVSDKYSSKKGKYEFHYLKVSDMNIEGNEMFFNTSNNTFFSNDEKDFSSGFIKPDSLIFPKRGAAIATNKKRITRTFSVLDPNLIGIEPLVGIDIKFLYYFFETFDLTKLQDNNVIPQLNKHNVSSVKMPLPSLEEQKDIVRNIDCINRKIEFLNSKKKAQSELFRTMLFELMSGNRLVLSLEFDNSIKEN